MRRRSVSTYIGCLLITIIGSGAAMMIVRAAEGLADTALAPDIAIFDPEPKADIK